MMIRRLWPSLVWALLILILTGVPGGYFPKVVSFWEWLSPDKAVHVLIFGVQAYLLLIAFSKQNYSGNSHLFRNTVLLSAVILFALLTEVLQTYVFIGRNGNVYDFIADVIGVGVGFLAYHLFVRKKKANS